MIHFTVVIPTYHRNDLLARCLDSLAPGKQTGLVLIPSPNDVAAQPADTADESRPTYEVVVTDDGRSSTAEKMIREQYPWAAWTQGPRRGPAANRNHGASVGRGEWVAFIDDDCVADPGWLDSIRAERNRQPLDVVEGKTIIPDKRDSPLLHGVENLNGDCYWSCNLAVRADVFRRLKGFDEDFHIAGGEDMEFAWRIRHGHLRSVFSPDALVLHPQRAYPLSYFWRNIWNLKWVLLYRQKTGAVPADVGKWRSATRVVRSHFFSITRNLVYGWRRMKADNWKSTLFYMVWPWVILPLQLPHLVYWELRFRILRTGSSLASIQSLCS